MEESTAKNFVIWFVRRRVEDNIAIHGVIFMLNGAKADIAIALKGGD